MTEKEQQLLAGTIYALVKGESFVAVAEMLRAEGLSEDELSRLIEFANTGVRETLSRDGEFQTGSPDSNGIICWTQPDRFLCSDNACPCSGKEPLTPGVTGYLYISKEVIEMRSDCLTNLDLQEKLMRKFSKIDTQTILPSGVVNPIFLCKEGANRRRLNLEVAANDAKEWINSGRAPLRVTPTAKKEDKEELDGFAAMSRAEEKDSLEANEFELENHDSQFTAQASIDSKNFDYLGIVFTVLAVMLILIYGDDVAKWFGVALAICTSGGLIAHSKRDFFSRGFAITLFTGPFGIIAMLLSPESQAKQGDPNDYHTWPQTSGYALLAVVVSILIIILI